MSRPAHSAVWINTFIELSIFNLWHNYSPFVRMLSDTVASSPLCYVSDLLIGMRERLKGKSIYVKYVRNKKRRSHFRAPPPRNISFYCCLDDVQISNRDCTVEVSANHLLAVASHHTLARSEVFWREDRWGDDQRNIRSINITCLKVATTLIANKNLVAWEVGVLVDREAVAQRNQPFQHQD